MNDHDRWVQRHLKQMRVERKQRRTIFSGVGARGRARITEDRAEHILYGPTGQRVRVIEYAGGNQIEQHDDKLHAVIRPAAHFKMSSIRGER